MLRAESPETNLAIVPTVHSPILNKHEQVVGSSILQIFAVCQFAVPETANQVKKA